MKILLFAGVAFCHLVLIVLLSTIVIFHESAPTDVGFHRADVVRQQEPPLPNPQVIPPVVLTPPPPLPSSGGGSPAVMIPLAIMTPIAPNSFAPHIPSSAEMIAKLSRFDFGKAHGSGVGAGDGNGDGTGNAEGGDGHSAGSGNSPAPKHPLKTGSTRIFEFITTNNLGAAKDWLEEGNDPNVSKGNWSALVFAIRHHEPKIVQLLLAHGANPDPISPNQRCSETMTEAIFVEDPESVRMLLNLGVKPDYAAASDPGNTAPFNWARPSNENSVLQAIAYSNCNSSESDEINRDPIAQLAIVKLLLDHGADPQWTDNRGRTPLSEAQLRHRPDLVELLKDYIKRANLAK